LRRELRLETRLQETWQITDLTAAARWRWWANRVTEPENLKTVPFSVPTFF
jgi:hypothetical protein